MGFTEHISNADLHPVQGHLHVAAGDEAVILVAREGGPLNIRAAEGAQVRLLLAPACDEAQTAHFELACGASVHVVGLFSDVGASVEVRQQAGSQFRMTAVAAGNASLDICASLCQPGAGFSFSGVAAAARNQSVQLDMRVMHDAPSCRSSAVVKGVASGDGRMRFEGRAVVAQGADGTDARQTSRNLLLGDEARITTLPQLEIYADDVKCSHGATVGRADDEAVMYMRQRGLSEQAARRLLTEGFLLDIVSDCAVGELAGTVEERLREIIEHL